MASGHIVGAGALLGAILIVIGLHVLGAILMAPLFIWAVANW